MDPFSITASIVTLIQVSAQVTILVKRFRDEVSVVDATLDGILNDVDGFEQVLRSMKETFAQEDIQADVQTTGHVGSHWKNLARSLSDGETTLDQLRSLLTSVNKSSSFLDAPRKQLRLRSAIAQIAGFREQIKSYRAALQLSLSTVIVWNQVTLQKSTAKLPEKITPNLNKLYDAIRNLGAELNAKIGKLEGAVVNQGFHAESELISMTNLKECVESAADVVSTASTTLGPEGSERASVKYGSDFGDVFKKESNETMQRWISSNTVYEFDDVEAPTQDPSETSTGDALTVYESDSDSDIENELVRALFNNGKKRKEQGDLHGAERHLRNCLSRFPSNSSFPALASSQTTVITGVSKAELLELLTETYCLQGSWAQAKSTMKEKLAITERQTGKKSERFLWDSFRLCEVLMNTKDYAEAHLHGRQSLRGFRKLREAGHDGYEKTLVLLVQICNEQGNLEDEEAYAALLGSHHANLNTEQSAPEEKPNTTEDQKAPEINVSSQVSRSKEATEHISENRSNHKLQRTPEKLESPEQQEPSLGRSVQLADPQAHIRISQPSIKLSSSTLDGLATEVPNLHKEAREQNTTMQELVLPDPNQYTSVSQGKQTRLSKLTPIPPLATQDDETALSPSSSTDAQPWSPRAQAALIRTKTSSPTEFPSSNTDRMPSPGSRVVVSKVAPAHQSMISDARDADHGTASFDTKLLVNLCQQELGKKPVFMIGRGREGYNCIVFTDESQRKAIAKVTGCKTREEARYNVASKAYEVLMSQLNRPDIQTSLRDVPEEARKDMLSNSNSVKEARPTLTKVDIDPPAYTLSEIPSNMAGSVNLLQSVPEIMVSPTHDNTTFIRPVPNDSAQHFPVRRAASDSRLPWQKNLNTVSSSQLAKPSAQSLRRPDWMATNQDFPAHRRAASTSSRVPEWKTGDNQTVTQPFEPSETTPHEKSFDASDGTFKRSKAQPGVTFDTIGNSIERPDHSYPDAVTSPSRGFSLLPSSLVKTFSLQDRKSRNDDPNLTKKKSLRFGLMSSASSKGLSTRQKHATALSPNFEATSHSQGPISTNACPLCSTSLHGLSDDEAWSHVNGCLEKPHQAKETAYELPASEPNFFAAELPAPLGLPQYSGNINREPKSPTSSTQSPGALSDLHRAFSKRDLSADKFQIEDEVSIAAISPLNQSILDPLQRQVILLGDAQCGKTWLLSAWCNGEIPKRTSLSATTFTKQMDSLKIVIQDHSGPNYVQDRVRRTSYGVAHAVLLCFDISSPQSFDNVEHKWNHEADSYFEKVPKILVGCKKDINRGGAQTVWTRDAYKLTTRTSARAYFETSAVTMEGLDALSSHVAQVAMR